MDKDPLTDAPDPDAAHEAIRSMDVRGAAHIGRTAAASLGRLARDAGVADDALRARLEAAGRHLIAARPTAVSLRNAVNLTLDGLREEGASDLRGAVVDRAVRYIDSSEAARDKIAAHGARAVPDGGAVLTHCHSSLAVAVLVKAHEEGKRFRVFTDETRPWWQGHITSTQLAEAGIDVTLIVDSAAHFIMDAEDVGLVLTGADTVTADGSLYNKVGTHAVALGAHSLKIPFMTACETHKFSPYSLQGEHPEVEERDPEEVLAGRTLKGVKVRNPVFDRTPPTLVQRYITEEGPVAPQEVEHTIQRRFGNMEGWL